MEWHMFREQAFYAFGHKKRLCSVLLPLQLQPTAFQQMCKLENSKCKHIREGSYTHKTIEKCYLMLLVFCDL